MKLTPQQQILVQEFRSYAAGIARKIGKRVPRQVALADLISEALLGLVRAALKYDPGHASGASFKTFATRYIRGAVLDYLRRLDPYTKAVRQKIKRGEVRETRAINYHDFRGLTDLKYDGLAGVEDRDEAEELLRSLPPLEGKILRRRYLDDVKVTDIAAQEGVSANYVWNLLREARRRLRGA